MYSAGTVVVVIGKVEKFVVVMVAKAQYSSWDCVKSTGNGGEAGGIGG